MKYTDISRFQHDLHCLLQINILIKKKKNKRQTRNGKLIERQRQEDTQRRNKSIYRIFSPLNRVKNIIQGHFTAATQRRRIKM